MRYSIDPEIFVRYPGFMRAVIIADGIDNRSEHKALADRLSACEERVRAELGDDFKELPRLASWAGAFRSMGLNPNKYPPSVVNLVKRARSGKPLPYVNTLVAAFNCVSLTHLCPCGGDELAAVQGDLRLTFATGEEAYVPLGQPEAREHPPAGEVIYLDTATKDVFCRAWCWKNGDRSKLGPETTRAAINIDIMPPLGMAELETISADLTALLNEFTGARTAVHLLQQGDAEFTVA